VLDIESQQRLRLRYVPWWTFTELGDGWFPLPARSLNRRRARVAATINRQLRIDELCFFRLAEFTLRDAITCGRSYTANSLRDVNENVALIDDLLSYELLTAQLLA
jgi:hypothetical protein